MLAFVTAYVSTLQAAGWRSAESPSSCSLEFPTLWLHPEAGWASLQMAV